MRFFPILFSSASVFLFATTGCNNDDPVERFCDRVTEAGCSVSGGGPDVCLDTFDGIRSRAEKEGCTAEFDTYLECAAGVFEDECTAGNEGIEERCPDQTAALAACDAKQ